MYGEVYQEWIKLFNEDFEQVWQGERKELQKVSLLLHALQKEINKVQVKVELEVSNLKQQLKYKDNLEDKTKSAGSEITSKKSTKSSTKENKGKPEEVLKPFNVPESKSKKESPDLFKDIDLNLESSSTDLFVIDLSVSEDDITKIDGSPTIKRRRKRHKIPANQQNLNSLKENENYTVRRNIRSSAKTNLFQSKIDNLDPDLSVIECTPEVKTKRSKTLSRVGDFMSKKKNRKCNKTLTQMFANFSKKSNNEKSKDDVDSDETYFEDNIDKSEMEITEMLQYINNTGDSKKQEINKFTNPRNKGTSISQNLDVTNQETYEISKATTTADMTNQEIDEISRDTTSTENIKTDKQIEECKAIITEPEPVVRGNARKQLQGWACQQCKNFYGQMELSPKEIQKKIDECSRHRYKYHPPEETIPGFWDLSIPPERLE